MGLYSTFQTNPDLEKDGVWLDYGDFRIRVARAGGANKKYLALAEKTFKPVRRSIEAGSMSNQRAEHLLMDVYSKAVVKDWETKVTDPISGEESWKKGIEDPDGDLLEVNAANIYQTFQNLPSLFLDLQQQADVIANFRAAELEEEAKNS